MIIYSLINEDTVTIIGDHPHAFETETIFQCISWLKSNIKYAYGPIEVNLKIRYEKMVTELLVVINQRHKIGRDSLVIPISRK